MSGGNTTLYGFSCYSENSSAEVEHGEPFFENPLRAELRPVEHLHLYRYTNPATGQKGGNWRQAVAAEIARCAVLFWWQHKDWFSKPVCVWELACFRARAREIEHALDAPAGSLDAVLVAPVPLGLVGAHDWAGLPLATFELQRFYAEVDRPHRYLRHLATGRAPFFDRATFHEAMQLFARNLERELEPYGGIEALLAVAPSDRTFVATWVEIARGIASPGGDAAAPEPRENLDARRRVWGARVGRELAHVPGEGAGFLLTARAERGRDLGPLPLALDAAGRAQWDAEGADELEEEARALGLRLPTPAEARAILALADAGDERRRQCGLLQRMRTFWCRDADGDWPRTTDGANWAAVLLVVEERR